MFRGGPYRADGFRYRGRHRYSLTMCTHQRQRTFRSTMIVNRVLYHLKQAVAGAGFEITAYCFMPDHLHLLTEGLSEDADLRRFVHEFKQRSAFEYKRATGQPLWQPRYHDHVLRDDEATKSVAGYIIQNPVRAGLVEDPRRYPFLGSEVYAMEDLLESVRR